MKGLSFVFILLFLKAEASFFDSVRGAISNINHGIGKLLGGVVTDVKETFYCTISAVGQVLVQNGLLDKRTLFNQKCKGTEQPKVQSLNMRDDSQSKTVSKIEQQSVIHHKQSSKRISHESEYTVENVNKTIINIVNNHNIDLKISPDSLKAKTNHSAEIRKTINQESEDISENVKNEIKIMQLNKNPALEEIQYSIENVNKTLINIVDNHNLDLKISPDSLKAKANHSAEISKTINQESEDISENVKNEIKIMQLNKNPALEEIQYSIENVNKTLINIVDNHNLDQKISPDSLKAKANHSAEISKTINQESEDISENVKNEIKIMQLNKNPALEEIQYSIENVNKTLINIVDNHNLDLKISPDSLKAKANHSAEISKTINQESEDISENVKNEIKIMQLNKNPALEEIQYSIENVNKTLINIVDNHNLDLKISPDSLKAKANHSADISKTINQESENISENVKNEIKKMQPNKKSVLEEIQYGTNDTAVNGISHILDEVAKQKDLKNNFGTHELKGLKKELQEYSSTDGKLNLTTEIQSLQGSPQNIAKKLKDINTNTTITFKDVALKIYKKENVHNQIEGNKCGQKQDSQFKPGKNILGLDSLSSVIKSSVSPDDLDNAKKIVADSQHSDTVLSYFFKEHFGLGKH